MKRLAGWAPHPESVFCGDRLPRSDRNDAAREQDMEPLIDAGVLHSRLGFKFHF